MTDLLRDVLAHEDLAEYDRLEMRRRYLAKQLPWTDDAFNEMIAINRQQFALALKPAREEAA